MAEWFSLSILLVGLTIATFSPISTSRRTSPPPSSSPPFISPNPNPVTTTLSPLPQQKPPSSLPPIPPPTEDLQFSVIIQALNDAGDFRRWVGLLSLVNLSTLPLSATLFVPGDDALSHLPAATSTTAINFDPFVIPYHIVPQPLSLSDLRLFDTHTRLPTLLPSNSILITNNSLSNFTVDGSLITRPDLLLNSAISVHGVENILDYSVYGGGGGDLFPPPTPHEIEPAPYVPSGRRSDAACLCTEIPMIFLVAFGAFAFKIRGIR